MTNGEIANHLRTLAAESQSQVLLLAAARLEASQDVADSVIRRSIQFRGERIAAYEKLSGQKFVAASVTV